MEFKVVIDVNLERLLANAFKAGWRQHARIAMDSPQTAENFASDYANHILAEIKGGRNV